MITYPIIVVGLIVLYILNSIKILREYERGVIFRLGRLLPQPKGPGLILVFSPIDRMVRISLRLITMDIPPQDVITKDNVTVKVNAVLYFRVMDPLKCVIEVQDYIYATSQLAQTTLRSLLGQVPLDDLLSEREKLNSRLQEIIEQHTDPWGIKVQSFGMLAVGGIAAMIIGSLMLIKAPIDELRPSRKMTPRSYSLRILMEFRM